MTLRSLNCTTVTIHWEMFEEKNYMIRTGIHAHISQKRYDCQSNSLVSVKLNKWKKKQFMLFRQWKKAIRNIQSLPLMTAEQFLLAFQCFVTHLGFPSRLCLDNAPQFKNTKNTIGKAWKHVIEKPSAANAISSRNTDWSFSAWQISMHRAWVASMSTWLV